MWTGEELILWGGDSDSDANHHANGAAFDPVAEAWRLLPRAPLAGRSEPGAVWTGTEVFIWGGTDGTAMNDGAAFDPKTSTWRMLPTSPLRPRVPVAIVWTGEEMIVWGNEDRLATAVDGAAYDPALDRWRMLPSAPLALNLASSLWTGEELIVYGAWLDGRNHADTRHAQGIAYDPETNEWRLLTVHPFSPQASTAVWTGDQLLVWDYELRSAAYDPTSDEWKPLPDLPLEFSECYPQGDRPVDDLVFAWHCGKGALFDLAKDEWQALPGPFREIFGHPVAADGVVLFAGAASDGSGNALWAYKPDPVNLADADERVRLPVTFPDGTTAVLTYPEELDLAGMGVQPDVSFLYRDYPPPRFPLAFYRGDVPEAALGGTEPNERLITRAGTTAELWQAPSPPETDSTDRALNLYRLVFRFGSWSVVAHVRNRQEAKVVAASLDGRETADGLIALEAFSAIALSDESGEGEGPRLTLGDAEPDPDLFGADARFRMIEIWVEKCDESDPPSGSGEYALLCLGGELSAHINGGRAFVRAVFDGLEAQDVRLGDPDR